MTFRGNLAQPPCSEQGRLQLDQVAQRPVQPDLECFQRQGLHYLSGQPHRCFTTVMVKNFFLIASLNLPSLSLKPLLLVLLQQALCPHLSYRPLFRYWKAAVRSAHSLLFSRLNHPNSLSLSSQESCSIPQIIFVVLLCTRSHKPMSFLCWGLQSWMQDSRWGLTRTKQRGRIPSSDLLAMLLLMQPVVQLAFWAASAHCHLMLSFSFTSTPKSFSSGLLSTHSLPSLYLRLGLPRPTCRTLHLALLSL